MYHELTTRIGPKVLVGKPPHSLKDLSEIDQTIREWAGEVAGNIDACLAGQDCLKPDIKKILGLSEPTLADKFSKHLEMGYHPNLSEVLAEIAEEHHKNG